MAFSIIQVHSIPPSQLKNDRWIEEVIEERNWHDTGHFLDYYFRIEVDLVVFFRRKCMNSFVSVLK